VPFQKHPRKVSHYGEGTPRRYRTDEMFDASELGYLLEPGTDHHKTELGKSKSGVTDRAQAGNARPAYADDGPLEAGRLIWRSGGNHHG
jgi:hypothetical protein